MSSKRLMFLVIATGMLLLAAPVAQGQSAAKSATTKPATAPAAIPDKTIEAMVAPFRQPPKAGTPEEVAKHRADITEKALATGWETLKAYPDAPNRADVYRIMIQVSAGLLGTQPTDESRKQFNTVVERVLASADDPEVKAMADYFRTQFIVAMNDTKLAAMLPGASTEKSADPAAVLEAFVDRHKNTPAAAQVYLVAFGMAKDADLDDLQTKYLKVLKENHMDAPGVKGILRRIGELSDVGKPFTATLTTLDGKKLTLPDDLKGKVVVIDFWATWCGPCVHEMPNLKKFHEAYKNKDVVVVGISLDESKADVEKFLKGKGYDWVHTFDGGAWENETSTRYGITGIPTVFVVGKDGNLFSDDARGKLETVVDRALKAQTVTTKPAGIRFADFP